METTKSKQKHCQGLKRRMESEPSNGEGIIYQNNNPSNCQKCLIREWESTMTVTIDTHRGSNLWKVAKVSISRCGLWYMSVPRSLFAIRNHLSGSLWLRIHNPFLEMVVWIQGATWVHARTRVWDREAEGLQSLCKIVCFFYFKNLDYPEGLL